MTTLALHDTTWRTTLRAHLIAGDSHTSSRLIAVRDRDELRTTLGTLAVMVAAELFPDGVGACPCGRDHDPVIVPGIRDTDDHPTVVAKRLVAFAGNGDTDALADLVEVQVALTDSGAPVLDVGPFLGHLLANLALQLATTTRLRARQTTRPHTTGGTP